MNVVETLTGFKYIGDQITKYEKTGENEFLIGYEESYGYLVGTYARDKDAVVASMLICEMAAYYKKNKMTLVDALNVLYSEYGFYLDALDSCSKRERRCLAYKRILCLISGLIKQPFFQTLQMLRTIVRASAIYRNQMF